MKSLPFKLVFNERKGFVDQVADGLRSAISGGYYKPGDVLPSRNEMAEILGVSVRVPRDAMKLLAHEGLVNPRRGVGATVLPAGSRRWRGRILFVWPDQIESSYFVARLMGALRQSFTREGYIFQSVALPSGAGGEAEDLSTLDMALSHSVDLVIALVVSRAVCRHLSKMKCRFVFIGSEGEFFPRCRWSVAVSSRSAANMLIAECKRKKLQRIFEVSCGQRLLREDMLGSAEGLSVEHCDMPVRGSDNVLGGIMQKSFSVFTKRFANRETFPDVVLCADDYIAFGAITALAILGVHAPEDVRLVTIANKGFVPAYDKTLARFEYDFAEHGFAIFDYALKILRGESCPDRMLVEPRYIPGETF